MFSSRHARSFGVACACTFLAVALLSSVAFGKVTLTFFPHGAPAMYDAHDLENAVKRFEALNPDIEIEIIKGASGNWDYMEQVLLRLASGLSVDIITPQPHWFLSTIDHVADLTPYMQRDGVATSDFVPGTIDAYMIDGKITGLPLAAVLRGSMYNARMLDEAGYNPPAPGEWTWDTVRDIGQKLTTDRDGDGTPEVYGVDAGGRVRALILFPLATQAGGMFFDTFTDPRESLIDSPAVHTALEYFVSFYQTNQTSPSARVLTNTAAYSMDAFLMMKGDIERQLGHEDVVFIPAPRGPVRGGFQQGAQGLQMMSSTEHPEEAWRFIKYMATTVAEVEERYRLGQREPSALVAALPLYEDLSDEITSFDNWMKIVSDPDNTPRYSIRSRNVEPLIEQMLTRVANNELPLESAIAELDRLVQAELDAAAQ